MERERYGSLELRKALQRKILSLSDELVDALIIATDAIGPTNYIGGSPFISFDGADFNQYLNLIYTAKGTFERAPYYKEIIEFRK